MYFRELAISLSCEVDSLPGGKSARDFAFSAHAVQEVFLSFMPRKFVLDGTAKTNLMLGPRGNHPQYWKALGVNEYFVEDFDFQAFFDSSTQGQDDILLKILEESLLDIANRSNADPAPIQKAIAATRACGCERRGILPRLSRMTRSRKLKLNVVRHIFHGGEAWDLEIVNRKDEVLLKRSLLGRKPWAWMRAEYDFRRSILKGDNFVVLGLRGIQTYRLNVKKLEERLLRSLER